MVIAIRGLFFRVFLVLLQEILEGFFKKIISTDIFLDGKDFQSFDKVRPKSGIIVFAFCFHMFSFG